MGQFINCDSGIRASQLRQVFDYGELKKIVNFFLRELNDRIKYI